MCHQFDPYYQYIDYAYFNCVSGKFVSYDHDYLATKTIINNRPDQPDDQEARLEYDKENFSEPICQEAMLKVNAKYIHQQFPFKLWNLASDEEFKPIQWSPDGMSLILNEYALDSVLKYFFRGKKFSSFLRQLHLYGFRKVTRAHRNQSETDKLRSVYISMYQCQHFQRDRYDLVKSVRRFYGKSNNRRNNNINSILKSPCLVLDNNVAPYVSLMQLDCVANSSNNDGNSSTTIEPFPFHHFYSSSSSLVNGNSNNNFEKKNNENIIENRNNNNQLFFFPNGNILEPDDKKQQIGYLYMINNGTTHTPIKQIDETLVSPIDGDGNLASL